MLRSEFRPVTSKVPCGDQTTKYDHRSDTDTEMDKLSERGNSPPHFGQEEEESLEQSANSIDTDDMLLTPSGRGNNIRVIKSNVRSFSKPMSKNAPVPISQPDALEESADSVELIPTDHLSKNNIRMVKSSIRVSRASTSASTGASKGFSKGFSSKTDAAESSSSSTSSSSSFTPRTLGSGSHHSMSSAKTKELKYSNHSRDSSNEEFKFPSGDQDDETDDLVWEEGPKDRNRSREERSRSRSGSRNQKTAGREDSSWATAKQNNGKVKSNDWSIAKRDDSSSLRGQWTSSEVSSSSSSTSSSQERKDNRDNRDNRDSRDSRDCRDRDTSKEKGEKGSTRDTRDTQKSSFSVYIADSQSRGIIIPRKSGRYESESPEDRRDDEDSDRDGLGQDASSSNLSDDETSIGGIGGTGGIGETKSGLDKYRSSRSNEKATDKYQHTTDKHQHVNSDKESKMTTSGKGGWLGTEGSSKRRSSKTETLYEPYDESGMKLNTASRISFVLVAHPEGIRTERVQCTIKRVRRNIEGKMYPTYELTLENPRKTLLVAQKMKMNRKANYHLFDMTRGLAGHVLSKKSGNYIGKLRATNDRVSYVLLNPSSDKEEIGGIVFERVGLLNQLTDGSLPRKMRIIVPAVDEQTKTPIPHCVGTSNNTHSKKKGMSSNKEKVTLPELLSLYTSNSFFKPSEICHILNTKEPVFENGNYRLNFHGRVCRPSVKNFQMIDSEGDIDDVICQFGKVDDDIFHLDFKAPLNAMQAFSLALCQFNL